MGLASTTPFEFDPEHHIFTQNGSRVFSITQVLAKAGICDFSFVEEELRLYSMQRGTSVHWLTQLEDEGALNYRTVPRSLRGYRKAWNTWRKRSLFHPILIEYKFVSPFGYAGIIDRAGSFPATTMYFSGTSGVVELKTGEVPDWARYQLAAQAVGIEPNLSVARTIRRIAVTLRKDGTYNTKEFPLCSFDSDISRFMHELRKINAGSN